MNDEARQEIRENWEKRYQGVGKNSKIAILQGGMEYQVISLTQKEMDYIESMKFTRDDNKIGRGKGIMGKLDKNATSKGFKSHTTNKTEIAGWNYKVNATEKDNPAEKYPKIPVLAEIKGTYQTVRNRLFLAEKLEELEVLGRNRTKADCSAKQKIRRNPTETNSFTENATILPNNGGGKIR